jgi:hypothetical protein
MPIDPPGPEQRAEPVEAPGDLSPSFGAGLIRPTCHWLPERMGAAAQPPVQSIASGDHDAAPAETDLDDERTAAIQTLVALAAKIEAARADGENASNTQSPATAIMPRFICDPFEETNTSGGRHTPEMPGGHEERTPAEELPVPRSMDQASRWTDVLRTSYPEAGLLLVAVVLLAALTYASAPRTRQALPGAAVAPTVAKIRADEAAPPAAPVPEDARLKFVGIESCSGRPCESLLAFTPAAAPATRDEAASGVSYTAAAQPDTAQDGTQDTTQARPPSAPEEPSAAPAQDAPPVVASTAGNAAPETEQIKTETITTDPIKTETVGTEPVLAAQEPAPAQLAPPADVSVAMPLAPEIKPGNVSEVPVSSAGIEPAAAAAPIPGGEPPLIGTNATKPPEASASATAARPAHPAKVGTTVRKAQPQQAAKKSAVAALSKPAAAKAALAKPTLKAPSGVKQAGTATAAVSKAPGFPPATPSSALIKPAPPAAVASKAPESPSMGLGASPGDKPPGFEIQTNLGGGFFAFQPY